MAVTRYAGSILYGGCLVYGLGCCLVYGLGFRRSIGVIVGLHWDFGKYNGTCSLEFTCWLFVGNKRI